MNPARGIPRTVEALPRLATIPTSPRATNREATRRRAPASRTPENRKATRTLNQANPVNKPLSGKNSKASRAKKARRVSKVSRAKKVSRESKVSKARRVKGGKAKAIRVNPVSKVKEVNKARIRRASKESPVVVEADRARGARAACVARRASPGPAHPVEVAMGTRVSIG